jgi:hypothetical protein
MVMPEGQIAAMGGLQDDHDYILRMTILRVA